MIAKADLIVVTADGQELEVRAGVGTPYRAVTGEWRCPVELAGLYERFHDMAGEDGLQALCMAASLLRSLLEDVLERGGRLLYAEPRSTYDLDATFGRVGQRPGGRAPEQAAAGAKVVGSFMIQSREALLRIRDR